MNITLSQEAFVCMNEDSVSSNTLDTLFPLLYELNPLVIVEAGTYRGTFAIIAARSFPNARILTADIVNHNWGHFAERSGLAPGAITFVQADFEQIAVRHPDIVGAVDVALVDSGWPTIADEPEMRLRHFRAAQRWVKPGGHVFVDDMRGDWVGRETIAAECCLILPTDRGLGVWRKHG